MMPKYEGHKATRIRIIKRISVADISIWVAEGVHNHRLHLDWGRAAVRIGKVDFRTAVEEVVHTAAEEVDSRTAAEEADSHTAAGEADSHTAAEKAVGRMMAAAVVLAVGDKSEPRPLSHKMDQ